MFWVKKIYPNKRANFFLHRMSCFTSNCISYSLKAFNDIAEPYLPGPSCSKLMMSLVNVLLKL